MSKAIGMAEYKTVSAGIVAADAMVKTADIDIVEAQTVCPGKYIILITGDLSAVNAAVETARTNYEKHLIDSFILGNPHDKIIPALYGATEIGELQALGILGAVLQRRPSLWRRMPLLRRLWWTWWRSVWRGECAKILYADYRRHSSRTGCHRQREKRDR